MHLKVLIIEDSEDDAALLVRYLKTCEFDPKWQRVDREDSLAEAVEDRRWDLVLCDLSMPRLTPFLAVDCVRQINPDIPIIIVTGEIREDVGVKLIQYGVQDIVLKDDLPRLKSVIRRELVHAQNKKDRAAAELRLANALGKLAQGVALYDPEARLITCNDQYRLTLDRLQAEIVPGLPYASLLRIALEHGQFVIPTVGSEAALRRLLAYQICTGEPFEQEQHDGRWIEVLRHRTEDGGIITVTTDITETKRREETLMRQAVEVAKINDNLLGEMRRREAIEDALRESEKRARAIFESAVDGVITFSEDRLIESVNPAAERIFGYTADELTGTHVHHLMLLGTPQDEPLPAAAARGAGGDGPDSGVRLVTGWRKSGDVFPIELTISEVPLKDRRIYTGIIRDVTERSKLDRMKREFVSVVGHELRTPLTSIRGALALLTTNVVGELPPRARSMVEIGLMNSERLLRLIGDILDMERIESGKMEFTFEPVPVQALIERAVEAHAAFVDQFGAQMKIRHGIGAEVMVKGDGERLMQVLANFLSNAAKFSPQGGAIVLGAERRGAQVRLFVTDEGPGIPEQFRERIFQKFSQADSSDTRQKGGTGLGLSIAKAIVECHGGTIGFQSEPGKGATFYLDLPILAAGAAPSQPTRTAPIILIFDPGESEPGPWEDAAAAMGYALTRCGTADMAASHWEHGPISGLIFGPPSAALNPAEIMTRLDKSADGLERVPAGVLFRDAGEAQSNGHARMIRLLDWFQKPADMDRLRRRIEHAELTGPSELPRILCLGFAANDGPCAASGVEGTGSVVTDPRKAGEPRLTRFSLVIVDAAGLSAADVQFLRGLCRETEIPPFIIISEADMPEAAWDRLNEALGAPILRSEQFAEELQTLLNGKRLKQLVELFEHQEADSREGAESHNIH